MRCLNAGVTTVLAPKLASSSCWHNSFAISKLPLVRFRLQRQPVGNRVESAADRAAPSEAVSVASQNQKPGLEYVGGCVAVMQHAPADRTSYWRTASCNTTSKKNAGARQLTGKRSGMRQSGEEKGHRIYDMPLS